MARCDQKRAYTSRLAAEAALTIAKTAWRRNRARAANPPQRVYLCDCGGWHLTHLDKFEARR